MRLAFQKKKKKMGKTSLLSCQGGLMGIDLNAGARAMTSGSYTKWHLPSRSGFRIFGW